MAENLTQPNDASVADYIATVEPAYRQEDSKVMVDIMRDISEEPPVMWGKSIIGFGQYNYTYDSGRSGRFFLTGFAPRKAALSVHIVDGFDKYSEELKKLGPHKTGRSCLYLKRLETIDLDALKRIIRSSVKTVRKRYPDTTN